MNAHVFYVAVFVLAALFINTDALVGGISPVSITDKNANTALSYIISKMNSNKSITYNKFYIGKFEITSITQQVDFLKHLGLIFV